MPARAWVTPTRSSMNTRHSAEMPKLRLLLLMALAAACSRPDDTPAASPDSGQASLPALPATPPQYAGEPAVVDDTLLRFPGGATFTPGFHGLEYLGQIPTGAAPLVVVGGFECRECDAPKSILVRSASAGPPRQGTRLRGHFAYPGRVTDHDMARPVADTRLFFGRCVSGAGAAVVQIATEWSYASDTDSAGVRRDSTLIAEVVGDSLVTRTMTTPVVVDSALIRSGRCREVPPRDQFSPP